MQPTITELPQDLKALLKSFNDHGVKYLIIGGVSIGYHAQPRYTKDLDLFIKADAANAAAVYRALAVFGAPLSGISQSDLMDEPKFFRFGKEPIAFDILTNVPGIAFDAAWDRRISGIVDEDMGLHAHIVSREDLISSKLASGRLQDLADVDAIRRAEKAKR